MIAGLGTISSRSGALATQAAGPPSLAELSQCAGITEGTVHAVIGVPAAFSVQPPAKFDPLTATDAELACYGFPKRPSSVTALAHWQDVMAHAQTYVVPASSLTGTPKPVTAGTVCSGTACHHSTWYQNPTNFNWNGYSIAASHNGWTGLKWNEVNGEWSTPYGNPNKGCHNSTNTDAAIVSPWVGIGGDGWDGGTATKLIQAGTDTYDTNPVFTTFWYENYSTDNPQVFVTTPSVNRGDRVYIDVQYSASTGYATYFYEDYTTNNYAPVSEAVASADQSSAEAVSETFPWNGNYMNYGSIEFFSPEAYGTWGSNYNISKLLSDDVTLSEFTAYSDSTLVNEVSAPSSIDTSGDFNDSSTSYDTC
jgi:hypothetical protein